MKKTIILMLFLLPMLCISQRIKVKVESIDSTDLYSTSADSTFQEYLIFARNHKIGKFLIISNKKDTLIAKKCKIEIGKKYVIDIELYFPFDDAPKVESMIWNGREISRKEVDDFTVFSTEDLIGLHYMR